MKKLFILILFLSVFQTSSAQPLNLWSSVGEKKIYTASKNFEIADFHLYANGAWWAKEETEHPKKQERVVLNGSKGPLGEEVKTAAQNFAVSRDGNHIAYKIEGGGKEFVYVDGKRAKECRESCFPTFSPDSKHVSFRCLESQQWTAVVDKSEHGEYDYIGPPVFSPASDEIAFQAMNEGRELLVRAGKEGKLYDYVSYPTYSPSGDFAYVANENRSWRVVHGSAEDTGRYDYITFPTFSPDEKHFAFNAQLHNRWFVVTDGKAGELYEGLGLGPVFSSDGNRLVYRAMKKGKWLIVDNKTESPLYDDIDNMPVLSPNGKHIAYAVKRGKEWFVVVDGAEGKHYLNIRSVTLNDSGIAAYEAWENGKKFLVVGAKEYNGSLFARTGEAMFSPDGNRCGIYGLRGNDLVWLCVGM